MYVRNLTFSSKCACSKLFLNGLVMVRPPQFSEWLLFVSVTEDLLGKVYVRVWIQLYYCDMQIATAWFVRETKAGDDCIFAILGSKRCHLTLEKKTCLGNIVIILFDLFCFFLTESGLAWKCLGTLFPFSQLFFDWRMTHRFCAAAIIGSIFILQVSLADFVLEHYPNIKTRLLIA